MSSTIRDMQFASDFVDRPLPPEMYNFANRPNALEEVATTTHALSVDLELPKVKLRDILKPLFDAKNFYGAYHELGVYRWLNDHRFDYEPQLELDPGDTLTTGGPPVLDGRFTFAGVYFDVKSFGFQYHLKELYRAQLQRELSNRVIIHGPMNCSVRDIRSFAMQDTARRKAVLEELEQNRRSEIPELHWDIRIPPDKERVTIETTSSDPYQIAEENRYYPFDSAKQFTRNAPFLLIFAFDYLFNGPLHASFSKHADTLFRSMSRRSFMQFQFDESPISRLGKGYARSIDGRLTLQELARLLYGILFIDISDQRSWLYTNPNATHAITRHRVEEMFDFRWPHDMQYDAFAHDNY